MELPARIGKYELEEFLGGGMSHVYRATDTLIQRTVAVKILTEQGCADEEVRARFLAEARMAGNLNHDHILSIYDFGVDDLKRPFMVMEFLRGQDLRSAIKHGQTGDLQNKLKIAVQAAKALAYIHSQKIVHRDIKPENIHINTAGVVKLIDFGIAKTEGLAMTRAGFVLGTPYYMAPEQVMGQEITPQVDVYAFGVMLFEIFTGVKPIQAETVERIFYFILNEPLKLEPMEHAGAPQSVIELVKHCTAKNPLERPQGFEPIVAELEKAMASRTEATEMLQVAPPAPAPVEVRVGRPAWLLPVVLVVIAGLSGGLYFATRPKPAPVAGSAAKPTPAATKPVPVPEGMILIPEGTFLYGEKKEPTNLPAYFMDRTEVSNAEYAKFCAAQGLPAPKGAPALPVVNITVQEAREFAAWAGKRLPTAKEWEKAARGKSGRMFPWGDQPDAELANLNTKTPKPVDGYPRGASEFGLLQMVGNVWELVDESVTPSQAALDFFSQKLAVRPDEPWFQMRGSSFNEPVDKVVIWDYYPVPGRWKAADIGFRCAKDAK
jgi:serine/threonine-protein kinase